MPHYRPKIDKNKIKQLEHYKFNLALFMESSEFKYKLNGEQQNKLLHELQYIGIAIQIAKDVFNLSGREKPIVGWEVYNKEDIKNGYTKIYHFSSAALASQILNLNPSKVTAVCKGHRGSTGGWLFKYLNEYLEEDEVVGMQSDLPFYEIIKR